MDKPLTNQQKRHSRNPSHLAALRAVQMNNGNNSNNRQNSPNKSHENVLASLRATQLVESQQKAVLPAELLATILDYLPVPDLWRVARASRRLREMVEDDTRWVQKLKAMRCWNEGEARRTGGGVEDVGKRKDIPIHTNDGGEKGDGFEDLTSSASTTTQDDALQVFTRVKSFRGHAKKEFGKVYAALAPFYIDLSQSSKGHSEALLFQTYQSPEQQAQMLANLKRFAQCDTSTGCIKREERLDGMVTVFEKAVMKEFEQACIEADIDGRVHRYAHVLVTLNGGATAVESIISNHPLLIKKKELGNPLDCLDAVAHGHVDLNPSQAFFERVAAKMVEQADIVDRAFPGSVDILTPLWNRVCEETIEEYITPLLHEAHSIGAETYVKAVAGTFGQSLRLLASLQPTKGTPKDFPQQSKKTLLECFDKHFDLYLLEEYKVFRDRAESDVSRWEKELSEQEASTESYFMSNVNRQAAKRDFLSSFKKVVMMPVNAFPISSTKSTAAVANPPNTINPSTDSPTRTATPLQEAPTTELAAKAAIMNSKLEGIKSLFSIEIALNLTHLAKASIERAALMVEMGDERGVAAQKQCRAIFITMLDILGNRHIKNGFDKAVAHLSAYNPREVRTSSTTVNQDGKGKGGGVEPLITFLELVNIGDLIQSMIDVFYNQELLSTNLTDRDDFLDPAVKSKRKFESMLDERVAAGLNRGIDVLMDEVEYICATTQLPSDYNPPSASSSSQGSSVEPTPTAHQVVAVLEQHTSMLVGSTEKHILDVFFQEVGVRFFGVLCKHFKTQRISVPGAMRFIGDVGLYGRFVEGVLRQKVLGPYFEALRELSVIYLVHIDVGGGEGNGKGSAGKGKNVRASWFGGGPAAAGGDSGRTSAQAKELAMIVADTSRYQGVLSAEEVYEFVERRADWVVVKGEVDRAIYGVGCCVM